MSIPKPPTRPTGNSPEAIFMQAVWDFLWDAKTNLFCESPSIHFDKTAKGYVVKIKPPGGGSTTTSSNSSYRGTWSPTPPAPYMVGDEVSMGAGTSAGMYVCTLDNNGNSPDSGTGWVETGSFATWL